MKYLSRESRFIALGALIIFMLAALPRIINLGSFFGPDEAEWTDRSRDFLGGLLNPEYTCSPEVKGEPPGRGLVCTLRTGTPAATTMWTGSAGLIAYYLVSQPGIPLLEFVTNLPTNPINKDLIPWLRLPTALLMSAMIAAAFLLVGKILSPDKRAWPAAFLAAMLMASDPFEVGLSRILHHDALETIFATLSLLAAFHYWGSQASRRWLCLSAALAGIAFVTKSPALFLGPFMALLGLWSLLRRRAEGDKPGFTAFGALLADGMLWLGIALLFSFMTYPALWVVPGKALAEIFNIGATYVGGTRTKTLFFLGNVSEDPGWLFYPVSWLLRSSPATLVGVLAAAVIGFVSLSKLRIGKGKNHATFSSLLGGSSRLERLAWLSALFAVAFIAFMSLSAKKQDRYILPAYPFLDIVAAAGYIRLGEALLGFRRRLKPALEQPTAVFGILAALMLLINGTMLWQHAPYYFTYIDPLLGGPALASQLTTMGWGEGLDQAAAYLNQKPEAEKLRVAAWYSRQLAPFFKGKVLNISDNSSALKGDYAVFYINQVARGYPSKELLAYFADRRPEHVVTLHGVDYAWIYPGPVLGKERPVSVGQENGAVLGGAVRLLGSSLSQPEMPADQALYVTLFWETLQPPQGGYNVYIKARDAQGIVWGQIDRLPIGGLLRTDKWEPPLFVRDEYRLEMKPGAPAGMYTLEVGMYRFDTGEVLGIVPSIGTIQLLPPLKPEYLPVGTAEAALSPEISLAQAELSAVALKPGQSATLQLLWRANEKPGQDFKLAWRLRYMANGAEFTGEKVLGGDSFSSGNWRKGEIVGQVVTLPYLGEMPAGIYEVSLRLLDAGGKATGEWQPLGELNFEDRPRQYKMPEIEHTVSADFGGRIQLLGYDDGKSDWQPGEEKQVSLYFRAENVGEVNYKVFMHLLDAGGQIVAQSDAEPAGGALPTSGWKKGEIITDDHRLLLTAGAPAGKYRLLAGLYNPVDGQRLVLKGGPAAGADNCLLGEIEIR